MVVGFLPAGRRHRRGAAASWAASSCRSWKKATSTSAARFPTASRSANRPKRRVIARQLIEQYPEVSRILAQTGRPNDGTDPTGFYNAEIFVQLKPEEDWPQVVENTGLARLVAAQALAHARPSWSTR